MTDKRKPGGYIWNQNLNEIERNAMRAIDDVDRLAYDHPSPEQRGNLLAGIAAALGRILHLTHEVQDMTDD